MSAGEFVKRPHLWVAVVVVVALTFGIAVSRVAPSSAWAPTAALSRVDPIPMTLDSDDDRLPDWVEIAGWRTKGWTEHRTDRYNPDSDGDGLSDGEEAGPASEADDGTTVYAGRSDPNEVDSDGDGLSDAVETGDIGVGASGQEAFTVSDPWVSDSDEDGIGDGDEYFLDMDPLATDSDEDGLLDSEELEFGSDPTLANSDDDSYSDKEEYTRGSNPLAYDLSKSEKSAAGQGGLKFGDCYECALDAGLRVEQIESVEYLVGHYMSGMLVYGDVRDVAFNIWQRNFLMAGLAAAALLPFIGDGSKLVTVFAKFAERGGRAEMAARQATKKLNLPISVKKKVLSALPGQAKRLPRRLTDGPKDYMVYKGSNYIGITNDFPRRLAQHAKAGRSLMPEPIEGASGLTRGEALAIKRACIDLGSLAPSGAKFPNTIYGPKHEYKDAAVAWGLKKLKEIGGSCPIPGVR